MHNSHSYSCLNFECHFPTKTSNLPNQNQFVPAVVLRDSRVWIKIKMYGINAEARQITHSACRSSNGPPGNRQTPSSFSQEISFSLKGISWNNAVRISEKCFQRNKLQFLGACTSYCRKLYYFNVMQARFSNMTKVPNIMMALQALTEII